MEWIIIGVVAVAVVFFVRRKPKSNGTGGSGRGPNNPPNPNDQLK